MKRLMLTAMHSGAGKTVATCALLAAMKKRGVDVRAFKCGPDYIDPMFHTKVLDVPSRNLDLFLQGRESVANALFDCDGEMAVLEGAMGFYDGLNSTEEASAWDIACFTDTPAVLVLRPRGVGVTLAAQVKGMKDFRPDSHIVGLLLADCKPSLAAYLTPILRRETGLPVVGYLPPMTEAALETRHLGLLTAAEVEDFSIRVDALADQMARTVDLDLLLSLAAEGKTRERENVFPPARCRIAVARDEAFCFCYEDNLDALRRAGAEPVFFSPLRDDALPEKVRGLYLCGGYPELNARRLSDNTAMRRSIRSAVSEGLPTIAECGGFLYLQSSLEDADGTSFPMCGVLGGEGVRTERLQRFGYQWLRAETDSLLFRRGDRVPVHEFHYWDCTENGSDLVSEKPGGQRWRCGYAKKTLYAAFPHIYLGGEQPLAERFVEVCMRE